MSKRMYHKKKRHAGGPAAAVLGICALVLLVLIAGWRLRLFSRFYAAFSASSTKPGIAAVVSRPGSSSASAAVSGKAAESLRSAGSAAASSAGSAAAAFAQNSAVSAAAASTVSLRDAARPLWISVSIASQTFTVYDADGRVVKRWLCSTGSPGYDTPKGSFRIYSRGRSFFSEKYQEGAYWWCAFYHAYYIHSVPFDKSRKIIPAIANDLGHKDSHGCVHLSIADSKWVYDHLPNGTKVVVS